MDHWCTFAVIYLGNIAAYLSERKQTAIFFIFHVYLHRVGTPQGVILFFK